MSRQVSCDLCGNPMEDAPGYVFGVPTVLLPPPEPHAWPGRLVDVEVRPIAHPLTPGLDVCLPCVQRIVAEGRSKPLKPFALDLRRSRARA